jgi:hypothetical protein
MQANIPPASLQLCARNRGRNPKNSQGSNVQRSNLKPCRRQYPSLSPSGVLTRPPQAHLRVINTAPSSSCSLSTVIYRCGTDVVHARLICTTMGVEVDTDLDAEWDGC